MLGELCDGNGMLLIPGIAAAFIPNGGALLGAGTAPRCSTILGRAVCSDGVNDPLNERDLARGKEPFNGGRNADPVWGRRRGGILCISDVA